MMKALRDRWLGRKSDPEDNRDTVNPKTDAIGTATWRAGRKDLRTAKILGKDAKHDLLLVSYQITFGDGTAMSAPTWVSKDDRRLRNIQMDA